MIDPIDHLVASLRENAWLMKVLGEDYIEKLEADARAIYGGTDCYISRKKKMTEEEVAERNNQIRKEFNGQNLKYICRKFELGRSSVYRIARRYEG